jgi:hypothetical protein
MKKQNKKNTIKIVDDCNKAGEPYFIFRARDIYSLRILEIYSQLVDDDGCPDEHKNEINNLKSKFQDWMENNFDKVNKANLDEYCD